MTKTKTLTRCQQELILNYLQWAENIAKRYLRIGKSKGLDRDELISSAHLGLCEAAGKYNPEKGKFTTYAWQYVKGQILRDITKVQVYEDIDDWANVLHTDEEKDNDERQQMLAIALENLTPREKKVICWTYGLSGEPLDFESIARVMHLSKKMVFNIKKNAMRKLKTLCA